MSRFHYLVVNESSLTFFAFSFRMT